MAEHEPAKSPKDREKKIHVLCATCQNYKGVLPVQYQGREPIPPELIDPESLTPSTPFVHICSAFPHPGGIPNGVLFSKRGHRRRLDGDHDVQYEPRFPILFTSFDDWRKYNRWARLLRGPDGRTLYMAWKPVVEKTIEYFLYAKSEEAKTFLQEYYPKFWENARKKYPILAAAASASRDFLKRRLQKKDAELPYGLAGVVLEFQLRVRGSTIEKLLESGEGIDMGTTSKHAQWLALQTAERLLLGKIGCPHIVRDTIKVLQQRYKNVEGPFKLRILSNGLVYKHPGQFRNIARVKLGARS